MSRSVVPQIIARLEPWLEECLVRWQLQPVEDRSPTLPATADGKINVRGVAQALGLPVHHEQHFFRHVELRAMVNSVAEAQGLKPIGARGSGNDGDAAVAGRLKQAQQQSSDLGKLVAEQAATIDWQRRQITALREQLRILEETGQIVRFEELS